jgi:hypothetical protein
VRFQFQLKQGGWTLNRFQGKYNESTLKLIHGSFLLPIEVIGGNLEAASFIESMKTILIGISKMNEL